MQLRTFLLLFCIFSFQVISFSQKKDGIFNFKNKKDVVDTVGKYVIFNDRLTLYGDVGTILPPFFIHFKDSTGDSHQLKYRINHGIIFGLGFSYKGIGTRVSYMAFNNIEKNQKYGETKYLGLQFKIPIKSIFTELTFYRFGGYTISNANKKVPTVEDQTLIRKNTSELFFEVAGSYFLNPNFDIKALLGKSGHYTGNQYSFYLKPSIGFLRISNHGNSIIPNELLSIDENNQLNSNVIGNVFLGFIPGIVYVTKYKNWQLSGILGIGAMMQYKYYNIQDYSRRYIGISPKLDAQIDFGYNPDNWFIMIGNELKFSHVQFNHLIYNGIYYNVRLTGGYRFQIKKKVKNTDNL